MNCRSLKAVLIPAFCLFRACFAAEVPFPRELDLGYAFVIELSTIPSGRFFMGSPSEEIGRRPDEVRHEVVLTEKIAMGRYPVTIGQFRRFCDVSGYRTVAERAVDIRTGLRRRGPTWKDPGWRVDPELPATHVTFSDAQAFCRWATGATGWNLDLPSEAEWEYACRAGADSRWWLGNLEADVARSSWYPANAQGGRPEAVGWKLVNRFGLEISGNVFEWCRDVYSPYPERMQTNPVCVLPLAGGKQDHVVRGGSWKSPVLELRCAARHARDPESIEPEIGFRIVVRGRAEVPTESQLPANRKVTDAPGTQPSIPETRERRRDMAWVSILGVVILSALIWMVRTLNRSGGGSAD